jgi:tetratricopeptide (TPR) repeat protein
LRPFTMRFARLIGRKDFDGAIDYLRTGLKGNASDVASLEMMAQCHQWARHTDEAIAASREALSYDPASFESHRMLALLLAERGEYEAAVLHARKGLECFPEPPTIPRFIITAIQGLSWIFPFFRGAEPDAALQIVGAEHAKWFDWAKQYLSWYDATHGQKLKPSEH